MIIDSLQCTSVAPRKSTPVQIGRVRLAAALADKASDLLELGSGERLKRIARAIEPEVGPGRAFASALQGIVDPLTRNARALERPQECEPRPFASELGISAGGAS